MRYVLSLWACCCLMSVLDTSYAADPNPPLELKIAIPVHHNHRSLNDGDHFHVLVRNVSDAPLRLWTDRFSWGYDDLSFEVVGDDGKVTAVKKVPRDWSKNYPDWLELQPGETYVLNVNLSAAGVWTNPPQAQPGKQPTLVKMRAVYEILPDRESARLGVWTGRLQSATETYAIW